MKKIMLTLITGVMLLSNGAIVSGRTLDTKHSQSNVSTEKERSTNTYSLQTQDPGGW